MDGIQVNIVTNSMDSVLDLVLIGKESFEKFLVHRSTYPLIPEGFYQPALEISFGLFKNYSAKTHRVMSNVCMKFDFGKADYQCTYDLILNHNWEYIYSQFCVNSATDAFYQAIYNIFEFAIPMKKSE